MDMEQMSTELLRFMESLPRRAPQNWLGEFSRGEVFLLSYLHSNGGTAIPGKMSEAMQTSTARIAAALNSLERKGWITREPSEDDRRQKLVHLTQAGADHIKLYRDNALKNITKLLIELGEKDALEYLRITQRMVSIARNFKIDALQGQ